MATYRPGPVLPRLTTSPFLDQVLHAQRGPDGVEMEPQDVFATDGDNMCCCFTGAIGVEACYQILGLEEAEIINVSVFPMSPAKVGNGKLVAIGKVVKAGRTTAICEANIYQGQTIISRVMVNFTCPRRAQ